MTLTTKALPLPLPTPPQGRTPDVTILVPAYNQAGYISRAIDSALMQDHPSLEVVLCDDASDDDTAAVAHRYAANARFRYCRRPRNLGRVANYRHALEHDAAGRWVLMLDGDDHLTDPAFIGRALRLLHRHAAASPLFVQAGQRILRRYAVRTAGAAAPHADLLPPIAAESALLSGGDYLALVLASGFFTHLGTLYSREDALRTGFYRHDIASSDMDSLLRLALRGSVLVMNTIAGCRVEHGANISSSLPLDQIEENAIIFRCLARQAARDGLIEWRKVSADVRRHEARTLAHLFRHAPLPPQGDPLRVLRMLRIVGRVHPGLFAEPILFAAFWRGLRRYVLARRHRSGGPAPQSMTRPTWTQP